MEIKLDHEWWVSELLSLLGPGSKLPPHKKWGFQETTAQLLSDSPILHVKLREARDVLGLKNLVPYPQKPNFRNLIELSSQLSSAERRKDLRTWIGLILKEFDLTGEWELPIKTLILTGTLPIPVAGSDIRFVDPKAVKGKTLLESLQFSGFLSHPAVSIQSRVTKRRFMRWAEENWKHIEKAIELLPTRKQHKIHYKTLLVGQWAYRVRQAQPNLKWVEMQKRLEGVANEMPDEAADDYYLSSTEIQKCHDKFVRKLEQLRKATPKTPS